jgi:hypothetical protein
MLDRVILNPNEIFQNFHNCLTQSVVEICLVQTKNNFNWNLFPWGHLFLENSIILLYKIPFSNYKKNFLHQNQHCFSHSYTLNNRLAHILTVQEVSNTVWSNFWPPYENWSNFPVFKWLDHSIFWTICEWLGRFGQIKLRIKRPCNLVQKNLTPNLSW